ncbi:transcription initiation factor TFIIE subunit beta [Nematocida sp. AWRm80]|nr:transcription initiation factor TFIIE subunit beta [Nematocida sp. AWRm80]
MNKTTYDKLSAGNVAARHTNIYIHTILTTIKKYNREVSFKEVEELTGIKIKETPGLLDLLEKTKKVIIDKKTLLFVPTYTIVNDDQLLEILKKTECKHGIPLEEILDTNINTRVFVDSLIKKGQAILLKDLDGSSTLFYNPVIIERVPSEIYKLYEEIPVPEPREITRMLSSAGLAIKDQEKAIRKTPAVQRKKRFQRRIKITNSHLNTADLGM